MKKLLSITILVLTAVVTANAQAEVLEKFRKEADALLGTPGSTTYITNHVAIEVSDDRTVRWWLRNPHHIFVGERIPMVAGRASYCNAKVALYSVEGVMIASIDKWKGVPSETGANLIMAGQAKMIHHANGTKEKTNIYKLMVEMKKYRNSYIRVVVPVYGGSLMDFTFKLAEEKYD